MNFTFVFTYIHIYVNRSSNNGHMSDKMAGFEFRDGFLLDWLPTKARDFSLLYYLKNRLVEEKRCFFFCFSYEYKMQN